jgi:hypothetical protein
MRFYSRFISFVLFMAPVSLVQIPATLAQVRQPGPTVTTTEDLPGANAPQYLILGDEQPVAGQNQNREGAKGGPPANAQQTTSNTDPFTATISGTVTDVNGDIVPGAAVVLEGANASDRQTAVASERGAFQFERLKPGIPYHVTVGAKGFEDWKSSTVILNPGQFFFLQSIQLKLQWVVTSVTVYPSPEQIATEQVAVQEHQRILGIVPNFYVTYDPNPAPLTTKLKFRLAYKADTDVMTFVGVAFIGAIYQAGDVPDYGQGWGAYGKRVAAGYADTTTDVFIAGAILPWLLHQDPRYFYQGTGTNKSRTFHAIFSPFVCRGDNGKQQPNYSGLGGDLASGAISNLYYPESNRGASLVFQGFAVTTGVRMVNAVLQEFLLRKLTPAAKHHTPSVTQHK